MSKIIQEIDKQRMTRKVPEFKPGDTVVVQVKVVEGDRERVQAYEGVVIAKSNRGLNSSFTVRKISHGEGVERVFQTYSPAISDITRQAPRQRAPRQALLPARPVRQGRAHRGEDLSALRRSTARDGTSDVRSFFSGLWRGLDGLRKVLHLLVLLVIFGVLVRRAARQRAARARRKAALAHRSRGRLVEQLSGDPRRSARSRRRAARSTPRRCCGI